MFLFLFQFLIKSIDQLIGKGLSFFVIFQLITLNLAWMVTLAVPMSVLVSVLMAYGSLASNNEITIMKASGISLPKLMLPVIIVSVILTYLMVVFNNDVLPEANHKSRILLTDISKTKPSFFLESGKFSNDINGARILVRKTFENSNNLEGIYIYDNSSPSVSYVITADKGDIGFTSDLKNVVMNLFNGEIHQLNNSNFNEDYRKVEFGRHRIIFSAEGFGFTRSSDNAFMRGDRELSSSDMNKIVDSLRNSIRKSNNNIISQILYDLRRVTKISYKDTIISRNSVPDEKLKVPEAKENNTGSLPNSYSDTLFAIHKRILNRTNLTESQIRFAEQTEKQIDMFKVEIYKKYSIPFACLIFTLIGAPLGYRVKKGGFGIAAGLSLIFFLIYWASLIGGEKLADRDLLNPFWGMWLVNILLGIFGLYLMFKSS